MTPGGYGWTNESFFDYEEDPACQVCGCTEERACVDEETGEACHWEEDDLCSVCAEPEPVSLGPCCSCGGGSPENNPVIHVVMLEKLAPVSGTGWGCVVCGLSMDGAVAVVCEKCFENDIEISMACHGFPARNPGGRTPVSELVGEHRHDDEKHTAFESRGTRA